MLMLSLCVVGFYPTLARGESRVKSYNLMCYILIDCFHLNLNLIRNGKGTAILVLRIPQNH